MLTVCVLTGLLMLIILVVVALAIDDRKDIGPYAAGLAIWILLFATFMALYTSHIQNEMCRVIAEGKVDIIKNDTYSWQRRPQVENKE